MQSDMLQFVAFDFVLRILWSRVVSIPFELNILKMHLDDRAGDASRLGVTDSVVSNRKFLRLRFAHRAQRSRL
jgi:hypothetical protein